MKCGRLSKECAVFEPVSSCCYIFRNIRVVKKLRQGGKYDVEFVDEIEELMDRCFVRLDHELALEQHGTEPNNRASTEDLCGNAGRSPQKLEPMSAVLCPITFPIKASLAAIAAPEVWMQLLAVSDKFTLTIWWVGR